MTRTDAAQTITAQLARWASELRLSDVPDEVIQRASHLLLDGVGCALIGAQLPWSRIAAETILATEGNGDRPVIGWGVSTSAPGAALLNGMFIQGFELDDFHPFAPLHSTSLLIPALLSAHPLAPGATGADLLRAAIVGFEVGPRVGAALGGAEMLTRGWHSGSVFGPLAVAAAVGNLLNLNGTQMDHAFGHAATQAAGLMAVQFGAMAKRMNHGYASRNGLYSALLARGGYTGIEGVFDQSYGGYLSTFGEGHEPDPTKIAKGLGQEWETQRIVVKPYAAMGGLNAAIDCLLDITRAEPIDPTDVERIDVDLSEAVFHHGWWMPERPLTPTSAQMNIAYSLAVALLDGGALAKQYAPSRIDANDVWTLIPKVEAHHRTEYDEAGSMGRGQTEVRITLRDGVVRTASRFAAKSILEPLTNSEVVDKFRALTDGVVTSERQNALIDMLTNLDSSVDLATLDGLLADEVESPFGPNC